MSRLSVVLCFIAACIQIAIALPLLVFTSNVDEFTFGFAQYLRWLFAAAPIVVLSTVALLAVLPQRARSLASCLITGIALAAYLQANVVLWNYGLLDGTAIDWDAFATRGIVDIALWLVILGMCLTFSRWIAPRAVTLCSFLMALQLITGALNIGALAPGWFSPIESNERLARVSSFSSQKNIIFILLDAFSGPGFKQLVEREPELKNEFAGFTYFKDTLSDFPSTFLSVPSILTGRPFDSSQTAKAYMTEAFGNNTLPHILEQRGYQSDLVTLNKFCRIYGGENCLGFGMSARDRRTEAMRRESLEIFEASLFRAGPQLVKRFLYSEGQWLNLENRKEERGATGGFDAHASFVDELVKYASVSAPKPTFKFFHLLVPHEPIRFDSECRIFSRRVLAAQETVQQQSRCALRIAGKILSRLKELGVFDNSLIVITGDHADTYYRDIFGPVDKKVRRPVNHYKFLPLLLIKPPGERAPLAERTVPALLSDIVTTVGAIAGERIDAPGEVLTSADDAAQRVRVVRNFPLRWKMWDLGKVDQDFSTLQTWEVHGDSWDIKSWHPREKAERTKN